VALGTAALSVYRFNSHAPVQKTVAAAPVPAKPAAPAPVLPGEISLPGKVQAVHTLNVPVPVEGTIEEFIADVGEDVTKGEVLARIKSPKLANEATQAQLQAEQARAQIASLEASQISARLEISRAQADLERTKLELDRAQKEYERQKLMMSEGVTPRLVFEKSEQDYKRLKEQAQSQADAAKNATEHAASRIKELEEAHRVLEQKSTAFQEAQVETTAGEVNSPADGVVVSRRGKAGEPVTRAIKDLFQIAVDMKTLQVVVSADPETLARIHPGQIATIESPEAQTTAQGKVREVRADQVTVDFVNPSPIVRPVMAVNVKIKIT